MSLMTLYSARFPEAARHDRKILHLARHQFAARERRHLVATAGEQRREIARKAHRDDYDRIVGLGRQQPAVHRHRILPAAGLAAALEERFAVGGLQFADGRRIVPILVVHRPGRVGDRNIGIAVPCIHQVDELERGRTAFVETHADQTDMAGVHALIEQVERQRIVDVVAHVGLENDGDSPFLRRCGAGAPRQQQRRGKQNHRNSLHIHSG